MFKSPGHIAFSIISVDVHYYGIIMALSILIGILTVIFLKKKYYTDIKTDTILDISFVLIIFGIIFARIYYVIMDYSYFAKNPLEIFAIWNGGISIHGAIIGGILGGFWYTKENKLNFLRYADLFTMGLIIGQAIGRWGNFFNSEAFGLPTNLPWKLYIPYALRPAEYINYDYFHPAFLYESLLNLIIFFILLNILKRNYNKGKDGTVFFSYLILYSIVRINIETIRVDSVLNISNLHIAHIAAMVLMFVGLCGLVIISNKKNL